MKIKEIIFIGLFFSPTYCMAVWDTTTPSGSEAKSMGDDRIREFKTDMQTSLQHSGSFPGSDTSNPRYIPTVSTGSTSLRPTGNDSAAGMFYVNLTSGCIEQFDGTNWACVGVLTSSAVVSSMLNVSVAGQGLGGGGGDPLRVNVDTTNFTFGANGDTVTVKADSIGTSLLADAVSFPTSVNSSTYTWNNFGLLPILQIQYFHTETSSNTINTSFVLTNLSGSFTPKSSTSKLLLFASGVVSQNVGDGGYLTLARNGTNLAPNTGGFFGTVAGNNYDMSLVFTDSPGTTSAITYSVMFRTAGGGGSLVFPVSLGGVVPSAGLLIAEIGQ